jgi:hypothetical protein
MFNVKNGKGVIVCDDCGITIKEEKDFSKTETRQFLGKIKAYETLCENCEEEQLEKWRRH